MRHRCRICKRQVWDSKLYRRVCKSCRPAWRARVAKRNALKESHEAYRQRLIEQGHPGTCDICGSTPQTRRLHVDHSHRTGETRGLLCYRCNYALRWFGDDARKLLRASQYLAGAERAAFAPAHPTGSLADEATPAASE